MKAKSSFLNIIGKFIRVYFGLFPFISVYSGVLRATRCDAVRFPDVPGLLYNIYGYIRKPTKTRQNRPKRAGSRPFVRPCQAISGHITVFSRILLEERRRERILCDFTRFYELNTVHRGSSPADRSEHDSIGLDMSRYELTRANITSKMRKNRSIFRNIHGSPPIATD